MGVERHLRPWLACCLVACAAPPVEETAPLPPPVMVVGPPSLDFGAVELGETAALPFTIRNQGVGPLSVQGVTLDGSPGFALSEPLAGLSLQAGESRAITIVYTAVAASDQGRALVQGDDPAAPQYIVQLVGAGVAGDTDTPADTSDTGTVAPTGDTGVGPPTGDTAPPIDCLDLPLSGAITYHEWVHGSEEFTFDTLGNLINASDATDAVWRTPYGGPSELVAIYDSWELAGHRFLLDGDLAIADEYQGAIMRQAMNGARNPLATGLTSPNSVTVRSDGMLYSTAYDEIRRVNPDTGDHVRIARFNGEDQDGLAFSPDYSTLYANSDSQGTVRALFLDAVGDVLAITVVAELGFGGELGGMAVDVCGNLYVQRTEGTLYRIYTDGRVVELGRLTPPGPFGSSYTTAVNFGSGRGNFPADHLFVMDRNGGLYEIEVGVRGIAGPHLQ